MNPALPVPAQNNSGGPRSTFARFISCTACFLAAAGLGWWFGHRQGLDEAASTFAAGSASTASASAKSASAAARYLSLDEAWAQLNALQSGPPPYDSDSANDPNLVQLLARINPADVPALFARWAKSPSSRSKSGWMAAFLKAFGSHDPLTAYSLLGDIDDPAARNSTASNLLGVMAALDPSTALSYLAQLPPGLDVRRTYQAVFGNWLSAHPGDAAKVAAAALALAPGPGRDGALLSVAANWARLDPAAGLAWAAALPPGNNAVLTNAIEAAAMQNPKLAITYFDKLPDSPSRNDAIGFVASYLSQSDPSGTLAWLDQVAHRSPTYDKAVARLFADYDRHDPAAAAALTATVSDPVARGAAIASVAGAWGTTDPSSALAWAKALPDSEAVSRASALNSIVSSWAKNDPKAALAFVQNSSDPTAYLASAPDLAQSLAQSDPQTALTWVNSLPDSPSKDQALSNILVTQSQGNFSAVWATATALPEGSGRDLAMSNLIASLSSSDPAKAASLLSQMDVGSMDSNAIQSVTAAWLQEDSQAASQWINTLPQGDQRDAAVSQLVMSELATNPSGAMTWANSISKQKTRVSAILHIMKNWGNADPAAALAAIQTANVPESRRSSIIQSLTAAQAAGGNTQ